MAEAFLFVKQTRGKLESICQVSAHFFSSFQKI